MKKTLLVFTIAAFAAMSGPGGARAQCCGDCDGDFEVTIDEIIMAVNRALDRCSEDGICVAQPCRTRFPASGQTTSYGPGSDGNVRAGAELSYTDNGDGTITDNNTGLMWEKKDDAGGIHDKDNTYSWGRTDPMDGTMVTEFLAPLNRAPCFAGHCDWRIPNVKELQSIIDYEVPYPGTTVHTAFHKGCVAGCTTNGNGGPMCSCTAADSYWSSTTVSRRSSQDAWWVAFNYGLVSDAGKSNLFAVRAVRGGLGSP